MARFSHTIIGLSIFLAIVPFLPQHVPVVTDIELLDTVSGVVGAGNFSYWQLGHAGPLMVELLSLSGDADLYVSDSGRPSYEIDKNNFSSATCGPDVVMIPADFPRPIGIGVFGDWSYAISQYNIKVYLDTTKVWSEQQANMHRLQRDSSERGQQDAQHIQGGSVSSPLTETAYRVKYFKPVPKEIIKIRVPQQLRQSTTQKKDKIMSRKMDEDRPRFLNLLNVLDMIFEMFVL